MHPLGVQSSSAARQVLQLPADTFPGLTFHHSSCRIFSKAPLHVGKRAETQRFRFQNGVQHSPLPHTEQPTPSASSENSRKSLQGRLRTLPAVNRSHSSSSPKPEGRESAELSPTEQGTPTPRPIPAHWGSSQESLQGWEGSSDQNTAQSEPQQCPAGTAVPGDFWEPGAASARQEQSQQLNHPGCHTSAGPPKITALEIPWRHKPRFRRTAEIQFP